MGPGEGGVGARLVPVGVDVCQPACGKLAKRETKLSLREGGRECRREPMWSGTRGRTCQQRESTQHIKMECILYQSSENMFLMQT